MATGIVKRHSRSCASRKDPGAECNCKKGTIRYEAWVYSRREGRKIRKSFPTEAAAKAWRADSSTAVRKGTMKAPTTTKVREAAAEWLAGAGEGLIRPRSGDSYKPSAIRSYEASLRLRVLPAVGHMRLSEVTRVDLQDLVDELVREGLNASTIGCTLLPLRAIYRRAINRGDVAVNPTTGLELPAVRSGRDRIASPDEAARLIAALPPEDRALWATAMYAGLRRGELQALRWSEVDLAAGVINVERSWDAKDGPIEPKSAKGRRKVPIAVVLRDYLVEHRMRAEVTDPDALVFGRSAVSPFQPHGVTGRARTAWTAAQLDRIVLHEARHTFASLMIAAGVNAKALSTYMGHANISITLDRYGHLMPGNEDEAAGLLDAYLERANTQARLAAIDGPADLTGAHTGAHPLSEPENSCSEATSG
jgi:integrase